jgi:hypothetical protein
MNVKSRILILAISTVVAGALLGCNFGAPSSGTVSSGEMAAFQKSFMSSYYVERGGRPGGARALTPFVSTVSGDVSSSRATVPVLQLTNVSFSNPQPNPLVGYPEPGLTTAFTVTSFDAANHVYDVVVTTTYPAADVIRNYVEEYYVQDVNPVWGQPADGKWTVVDPIVKWTGSAWVQDQMSRVRQVLTFADGTTRNESIITQTGFPLATPAPKFAAFDINAPLDYSQLFVPAADSSAVFSSVVLYSVTPAKTSSFWFWQGAQNQSILGIRYYTEFKDTVAQKYRTSTVLFEKTLNTLNTTGVSTPQVWQTVFVGSQYDTLAESVLRQQVTYDLDANGNPSLATGVKVTNMQTRVVNIAGQKDFYLQQLNTDYVSLSNWDTTTAYTPTGDVAEVLAADPSKFLYSRTLGTSGAVASTSGLSDLAQLYTSLVNNAVVQAITPIPAFAADTLPSPTADLVFDGTAMGKVIHESDYPAVNFDLNQTGTIEAWVYIKQHTDTGGIVHKGELANFSDESYSLQFWGNQGQIALVLDTTGGSSYDLVTSTINLNTGKWYYLVATWDKTVSPKYMNLYVDGVQKGSAVPSLAGAPQQNNAAILIGSQLPNTYSQAYGYFSFNGAITGVKLSTTPMSAATALANYNTYVGQTTGWPHP